MGFKVREFGTFILAQVGEDFISDIGADMGRVIASHSVCSAGLDFIHRGKDTGFHKEQNGEAGGGVYNRAGCQRYENWAWELKRQHKSTGK
jgi:hypothetical protein